MSTEKKLTGVAAEQFVSNHVSFGHILRKMGGSLPDRQTCRVCREYRDDSESRMVIQGLKCRNCELWCKEAVDNNNK
ncbi:hypothetical protein TNCV_103531 [Trichonephila clavipes]|nr:hypothetical protein TNCV_103531 [Trichonephila clavipes]